MTDYNASNFDFDLVMATGSEKSRSDLLLEQNAALKAQLAACQKERDAALHNYETLNTLHTVYRRSLTVSETRIAELEGALEEIIEDEDQPVHMRLWAREALKP